MLKIKQKDRKNRKQNLIKKIKNKQKVRVCLLNELNKEYEKK